MTNDTKNKSTWPKKAAIVVSETKNFHMILRELMRAQGWTVIDSTPSLTHAFQAVQQGQAYIVIFDDSQEMPASQLVRMRLTDPFAICTPTLAFLLESRRPETAILSSLGHPSITEKPLTPGKFIPTFNDLIRKWEREPWLSLRRATYMFLQGQQANGLKTLLGTLSQIATIGVSAPAVAAHLRRLGRLKDAETILLNAITKAPKDTGIIVSLADLYLHSAMPKIAYRLLSAVQSTLINSFTLYPDLVQATLFNGKIDEGINLMFGLQRSGLSNEQVTSQLIRLLFAQGRVEDAEKLLLNNKKAFKSISESWDAAEDQSLNVAG